MSSRIVENNTIHKIHLTPTKSFPKGVWLEPGVGNVPQQYFDEAEETVVRLAPVTDLEGKVVPGPLHYPAKENLNQLLTPVYVYDAQGTSRRQPQITVYTQDQAPAEDRSAWPEDLNGLTEKQALAFVKACTDSDVLKRWTATAKNEKVLAQLRTKGG